MATIRITDDQDANHQIPVVKMECDCGWVDKTYRDGCLGFGTTHFSNKHGGYGDLMYKGETRKVINGTLQGKNVT